jgi:carboxypeptidase PM20D1
VFVLANSWLLEPLTVMQMRNTPGAEDLLSTTVQPTIVAAGAEQSQRPTAAQATVNVRLHPRDDAAAFLSRARTVTSPFPGVKVEWARAPGAKPPLASHTSDSYRLIAGLAARASNGATVAPALYVGSTDARHYAGVAENVYRFTPAVWSSDDIRSVMNANEKLSQANFARMIQFYHQLLSESAK